MKRVSLVGPDGIRLERAAHRHAAALRDWFNSGVAAPSTRWHLPRSLTAWERDPRAMRRYVILDDERLIGTCRLWVPQFSGLELAIAVFDPAYRGRGIGSFAVRTMCAVAFEEVKTHRVELGVYPDNAAAIRVYEKCGFRREAVLRKYVHHDGAWRDVLWMAILRNEWLGGRR